MNFENLIKKTCGALGLFFVSSLLIVHPVSAEKKETFGALAVAGSSVHAKDAGIHEAVEVPPVPSDVPVVVLPEPSEVPEGSPEPSEVPEGSPEPSEVPEESPEPSELPEGSPEPSKVPEGSPEPSKVPEGSPKPSKAPTESPKPSKAPAGPSQVLRGFVKDKNGNVYYYVHGKPVKNVLKKIKGHYYYFGKKGIMAKGLKKIHGAKYYFSKKTGKALRGLKKINGKKYYFWKKCQAVTGWKRINGEKYYFLKNCTAATGLKKIDKALYYFKASGRALREKKITVDGKSYYFGPNGKAKLNGWLDIGTKKYYASAKGTLKYYWKHKNGVWHLYNMEGEAVFSSNTLYQAWNRAQSMSSATSYFIAVDTAACRVMVFQGAKGKWVPIKFFICSPGKSSSPTVRGIFTVGSKGYCFGRGFTCYYYTQFHGNYLFHSVLYYQGTFRKKDGRLGQHLSHGCVRLDIGNAKWIYSNIPHGTKVYTY